MTGWLQALMTKWLQTARWTSGYGPDIGGQQSVVGPEGQVVITGESPRDSIGGGGAWADCSSDASPGIDKYREG